MLYHATFDCLNTYTPHVYLSFDIYVTHLYKTSHMSQKHVHKEGKMGCNLVQKIFSCDNSFQSYARLNALNIEKCKCEKSLLKVFIEELGLLLGYHD